MTSLWPILAFSSKWNKNISLAQCLINLIETIISSESLRAGMLIRLRIYLDNFHYSLYIFEYQNVEIKWSTTDKGTKLKGTSIVHNLRFLNALTFSSKLTLSNIINENCSDVYKRISIHLLITNGMMIMLCRKGYQIPYRQWIIVCIQAHEAYSSIDKPLRFPCN